MKKVILTLVAVATMGIANAQLFVGGNIGFGMQKGSSETTISGVTATVDQPKTIDWTVAPKIGFQSGKMSFGAILGIGGEKTTAKDVEVTGDELTEKIFAWQVCPFFRYNAFEFGNFALFCELQVPIMGGKASTKYVNGGTTIENKNAGKPFSFGVEVVPGLNYSLSDHLNFDVYVNLLAIGFNMNKVTVEDPDTNDKQVDKTTEFWAGVNSLPQAITLGFNYNF